MALSLHHVLCLPFGEPCRFMLCMLFLLHGLLDGPRALPMATDKLGSFKNRLQYCHWRAPVIAAISSGKEGYLSMVLAWFCLMPPRASQSNNQCCSSSTTPLSQQVRMRLLYRLSWLVCSLVALTGAWLSRNLDSARFFVLSAVRYAGLSSSECSAWAPPSLIHCAYLQRCLLLLTSASTGVV
jgi:hypothetical protein